MLIKFAGEPQAVVEPTPKCFRIGDEQILTSELREGHRAIEAENPKLRTAFCKAAISPTFLNYFEVDVCKVLPSDAWAMLGEWLSLKGVVMTEEWSRNYETIRMQSGGYFHTFISRIDEIVGILESLRVRKCANEVNCLVHHLSSDSNIEQRTHTDLSRVANVETLRERHLKLQSNA